MQETSATTNGTWVRTDVSYVNPTRDACAFCGRPLARTIWRETVDGKPLQFCEPAHAGLYVTYWLPIYGAGAPTSS
jgi:hypothetical protein